MRWALALATAVIAVLLSPTAAAAHTDLESTEPPAGSSVPSGTSEVRFDFSEPVDLDGAVVELVTADGARTSLVVVAGPASDIIVAALPEGIAGPVELRWSVGATDGHLASGGFGLGLGGATAPGSAAGPASSRSSHVDRADQLLTAARVASYLAMAILVGGWVFLVVAWPTGASVRGTRRLLWGAASVGLLASLLGIAAQSALARQDLSGLLDVDGWRTVASRAAGRPWFGRAALFVLAAPVLVAIRDVRASWWRVGAAAVGVGLLRTPGFAAHSTTGAHAAVGSIADLAHLVGVAAWFGGLVVLAAVVLPRRRPEEIAEVVPRFSRLAMSAIVVIVAGGALLSWQLLGGIDGLFGTAFGRTLLLKLGVFGGAMAAAQRSRRWVDRHLRAAADDRLVGPMVWSVTAEVVLAVAVIALAGVLVGTNPPT